MNEHKPLITVITVSRRTQHLRRCLQSVQQQTYDGEIQHLLIIDDNPTAEQILADTPNERASIAWQQEARSSADQDGPQRLAVLRNLAVEKAGDSYIAFLDDDNAWTSDHLESLWSVIAESDADLSHSQRLIFWPDGRPYLTEEFPWGRDAQTRRAVYAYCLDAGIMSPGSNIMRDRLEMRFTWVDLGEWLFPPLFLRNHPFETHYGAWEWFNISVEDRSLPKAIYESGLQVAATESPTLHYYLGGYTNNHEGDGVVWRRPDAADGWRPRIGASSGEERC